MSGENEKAVAYFEDYPDMLGIVDFVKGKTDKQFLTDFFALCWFVSRAYGDMEAVTGNAKGKVMVTLKKVVE